jgi:chromosome segregation ATPase
LIEYALLFGLGFLAAGLMGLLVSPAIHRSIVRYTETRLKATMPLTAREVRAQKDMARAVYATETARVQQDLVKEREKATGLMVRNDTITRQMSAISNENAELKSRMDLMMSEISKVRDEALADSVKLDELRTQLLEATRLSEAQTAQMDDLVRRKDKIMFDLDNAKIELATSMTEAESLHARITGLRDERDGLRREVKTATDRAKDLEFRLVREENKTLRLEEKLEREQAANMDKAANLERRMNEISRLKQKVKDVNAEAREALRALKAAGVTVPQKLSQMSAVRDIASNDDEDAIRQPQALPVMDQQAPKPPLIPSDADLAALAEQIRNRNIALGQLLMNSTDSGKDDAIRDEIAGIAAEMIALTATREGAGSPIRSILSANAAQKSSGRISLAERATSAMFRDIGN